MAHIGQHFLAQECGERGGALGRARRAEPTTLAREGHQELGPASAAPHAGEAVFEDAAVEVGGDCLVDAAPPEAVAPLEALFPLAAHLVNLRLDKAVQRRRLGATRAIQRAGGSSHGSASRRGVEGSKQTATGTR